MAMNTANTKPITVITAKNNITDDSINNNSNTLISPILLKKQKY